MKLITEGNVNIYYLQTLCLLFFPGAKFSQNEKITPQTPVIFVKLTSDEKSSYAEASVTIGEKSVTKYYVEPFDEWDNRKKADNIAVSKAFYDAATSFFKYNPPWGILTGVRPTKLAFDRLNAGMTRDQTIKSLRTDYLLFLKKAMLAVDIARNESKIIKKYGEDTCSLYISIPFCPSRCEYCSFVSYTTKKLLSLIPDYLQMLKLEIKLLSTLIAELNMKPVSIYIGGGTPTTLDEAQLEDLLSYIDSVFDTTSLDEFTLEAGRPDTVTAGKLLSAKNHNVTRVSINPQSLSDDILKAVGRKHTVEDFFTAYELAARSGIQYINTDLIIGLPGDDFENYSDTLDRVISLDPDNITAHTLCAKRSAELKMRTPEVFKADYYEISKCVDYTQILTKKAAYYPYYMYRQKNALGNFENVGFSKKGAEGIYNILMMEEVHTIFAAGAGAVTKLVADGGERIERIFNPKYPYEYLSQDRTAVFESVREKAKQFFTPTE